MAGNVGLNVGGKIYLTSRLTLTRYPDSFFSSLLDGDIPSDKDDQGNYLIDQDGKIFRHVLNFLRYGKLQLPEGYKELGLLTQQADFFLLHALKELIEEHESRKYIGLNVGGKIYQTSRANLERDPGSLFSSLLDGSKPFEKDDQGNYLIDQDGEIFRHVLNFLRYRELQLPKGFKELNLLRRQADYFLLRALKTSIHYHDPQQYIGLNVGGRIYQTSRENLSRHGETFFSSLLDGSKSFEKDDQGNYLIDQDGEIFRHVLNFMRYDRDHDWDKPILPKRFNEVDLLKRQAEFFWLEDLEKAAMRMKYDN